MLVRGEIVSFKMVLLPPDYHDNWPKQIKKAVPGAEVEVFPDAEHAARAIEKADCAYGYLPPTLFERAEKLPLDTVLRGCPGTPPFITTL